MEIGYNDRGGLTNQERKDGLYKKVARGNNYPCGICMRIHENVIIILG